MIESKNQYSILKGIYDYRILTLNQIEKYLKLNSLEVINLQNDINYLLKREYISAKNYDFDQYAFGLTSAGYKYITASEEEALGKEIVNKEVTFSKYKMDNKLINHQIHLNNVVIDCFLQLKENDYEYFEYLSYFDEKNFLANSNLPLRPDGIIVKKDLASNNTYLYFLEMDMETESMLQLSQKWDRYYELSKFFFKQNKNTFIKMVFIAPTVKRLQLTKQTLESRISLIKESHLSFFLATYDEAASFIQEEIQESNDYLEYSFSHLGSPITLNKTTGYKSKDKIYIPITSNNNIKTQNLTNYAIVDEQLNLKNNIIFVLDGDIENVSVSQINKIFAEYNLADNFIKNKYNILFSDINNLDDNIVYQITDYETLNLESFRI